MEATLPVHDLPVTDSMGSPLATGDRVRVTGSSRFGENDGTVHGYIRQVVEDKRLGSDGDLFIAEGTEVVRIRVTLDNGVDGDDYTASQGRVTKIDTENSQPNGNGAASEADASAA